MYKDCWDIINSNHVFRNMTLEASQERCSVLANQSEAYVGEHGDWLKTIRGK
jgi:hypothetical protein